MFINLSHGCPQDLLLFIIILTVKGVPDCKKFDKSLRDQNTLQSVIYKLYNVTDTQTFPPHPSVWKRYVFFVKSLPLEHFSKLYFWHTVSRDMPVFVKLQILHSTRQLCVAGPSPPWSDCGEWPQQISPWGNGITRLACVQVVGT